MCVIIFILLTGSIKETVPLLILSLSLSLDTSLLPKRSQAVRGAALLWQPEIIFPYLALLEKYTSTPDLMEAAVGAIQNLTACSWKVRKRGRGERERKR